MHWSWIDVIVLGFKSVEELYPSPPLGVDSADTSQLPKEKNLHEQFQYFQITSPVLVPLYLCTNRGGECPLDFITKMPFSSFSEQRNRPEFCLQHFFPIKLC
jgi:hypothetical protein